MQVEKLRLDPFDKTRIQPVEIRDQLLSILLQLGRAKFVYPLKAHPREDGPFIGLPLGMREPVFTGEKHPRDNEEESQGNQGRSAHGAANAPKDRLP